MSDFDKSINDLDLGLFEKIESQSTLRDKQSLLACQLATREQMDSYVYLEIGSYLGGSLQPHLLDPLCRSIYSIDKRPPSQPDERGYDWKYENNSTRRMLDLLSEVAPDTGKITTIDSSTGTVNATLIPDEVDLCFIDGEHTDRAVFTDFTFCLEAVRGRGAILLHDADVTYNGIARCIAHLETTGVHFNAYLLPDAVFVVEIGDFPVHRHRAIAERLVNNHQGVLHVLQSNDRFRQFANTFPFGMLRRLRLKLLGGNVSR